MNEMNKTEKLQNYAVNSGNIYNFYLIAWFSFSIINAMLGTTENFDYTIFNYIIFICFIFGGIITFLGRKIGGLIFILAHVFQIIYLLTSIFNLEKVNFIDTTGVMLLTISLIYFLYKIFKLWRYMI